MKGAPGVEDAIVVGVPDPVWGRKVVALVRVSTGYDEREVHAAILADLAAYKLSKRTIVLAEVPRHASGKNDYRTALDIALRETGAQPT